MRPDQAARSVSSSTSMGVEVMSSTRVALGAGRLQGELPAVRVRHQARDAAVLMAFSAASSVGLALLLLLLATLVQRG